MKPITIDFHVHITSPYISNNWKKYASNEAHFNLLCSGPKNKFATADELINEMDNKGIDKAVVFGFAFKNQSLCKETNDYVMESVRRYKDRLIGFACVNPIAEDLEKELDRCLAGGLVGVGELMPDGQGYKIDYQNEMNHFTGLCIERSLPVLIHVNEPVGHYYPGKTETSIKQAYTFAENNQKLKIIYAHLGGGLWFYELMPEVKDTLKNVYYDTAAGPFLYTPDIYKAAAGIGLHKKIVLGSDYPLLSPSVYLKQIDDINLMDEEKAFIIGKNAISLLNGGLR